MASTGSAIRNCQYLKIDFRDTLGIRSTEINLQYWQAPVVELVKTSVVEKNANGGFDRLNHRRRSLLFRTAPYFI